ncbi:MAG: hypothetical protein WCR72_16750 [Bacteroidota bacterium]
MKTALLVFVCSMNLCLLKGQNSQPIMVTKVPCDTLVDIDTLVGIKNKNIIFAYDTLYIINRFGVTEFVRCVNDLKKLKDLSVPLNSLSGDLSAIQNNVDSLYMNMRLLTAFIKKYEEETKLRLEALSNGNTRLTENLETITKQLEEAQRAIKAEKWKSLGVKILWGSGGIVVGGLIMTALLL